ncbi:hypothetical protein V8C86DRAFT_2454679, partial [Haematococcus lacustris]
IRMLSVAMLASSAMAAWEGLSNRRLSTSSAAAPSTRPACRAAARGWATMRLATLLSGVMSPTFHGCSTPLPPNLASRCECSITSRTATASGTSTSTPMQPGRNPQRCTRAASSAGCVLARGRGAAGS